MGFCLFRPRPVDSPDLGLWRLLHLRRHLVQESFALTLLRLTDGWTKWAVWFIIVSMNLAMGISALLPFVACTPIQRSWNPFITEGHCFDPKIIVDYDIFSAGEFDPPKSTLVLN